jgi:hypothetical protein
LHFDLTISIIQRFLILVDISYKMQLFSFLFLFQLMAAFAMGQAEGLTRKRNRQAIFTNEAEMSKKNNVRRVRSHGIDLEDVRFLQYDASLSLSMPERKDVRRVQSHGIVEEDVRFLQYDASLSLSMPERKQLL